MALYTI
ncbi:hypothetical protein D030_0230A, partial [Vibrio parahaemolyticus AQ3810]